MAIVGFSLAFPRVFVPLSKLYETHPPEFEAKTKTPSRRTKKKQLVLHYSMRFGRSDPTLHGAQKTKHLYSRLGHTRFCTRWIYGSPSLEPGTSCPCMTQRILTVDGGAWSPQVRPQWSVVFLCGKTTKTRRNRVTTTRVTCGVRTRAAAPISLKLPHKRCCGFWPRYVHGSLGMVCHAYARAC